MFYQSLAGFGPPRVPVQGVRGIWAYRCKQHFFRSYLNTNADIYDAGIQLAGMIPPDREDREVWIDLTTQSIANELLWRAKNGVTTTTILYPDMPNWEFFPGVPPQHPVEDRRRLAFMDVVPISEQSWLRPDARSITWTYIIDLEDHAFTVNGYLHFSFSDMLINFSRHVQTSSRRYSTFCMLAPGTSSAYVARVRRWSAPFLSPEPDHVDTYDSLSPVETSLKEWGVRGWDNLTTSEMLSVNLVSTILLDQSSQIRNPNILSERRMFDYCRWQILTAAAPFAVTLPPSAKWADFDEVNCEPVVHIALDLRQRLAKSTAAPSEYGDWKEPAPMWFRGCLIILCYRLDTLEFVKDEVYRIVQALKHSRRTSNLGLLFDGEFVVGVALDSTHIRRSPILRVYDSEMKLEEGILLIMHILSPPLTIDKTPWRSSPVPRARASFPLPLELVIQITRLVDYDTYSNLQFVSHGFRSLYLSYPRLANVILLGATSRGFNVLDTTSREKYHAGLYRTLTSPYPDTLNQSFYHSQRGLGMGFYTAAELSRWYYEYKQLGKAPYCPELPADRSMFKTRLRVWGQYREITNNEEPEWELPEVKTQVVMGTWEFRRQEGSETWGYEVTPWPDVRIIEALENWTLDG